jgi:hypothetical protein
LQFIGPKEGPGKVPPDMDAIKNQLFKFGPVAAGMDLYRDFFLYQGGIYIVS